MEASTSASWPAHTCKDPAACWTSFFAISIINFPAIRRITSPTPIGQIPGFLLREIKRSAMNASRKIPTSLIDVFKYLVQSVLDFKIYENTEKRLKYCSSRDMIREHRASIFAKHQQ